LVTRAEDLDVTAVEHQFAGDEACGDDVEDDGGDEGGLCVFFAEVEGSLNVDDI
jgi:hypothetical protein